jgi:hypothetical protein
MQEHPGWGITRGITDGHTAGSEWSLTPASTLARSSSAAWCSHKSCSGFMIKSGWLGCTANCHGVRDALLAVPHKSQKTHGYGFLNDEYSTSAPRGVSPRHLGTPARSNDPEPHLAIPGTACSLPCRQDQVLLHCPPLSPPRLAAARHDAVQQLITGGKVLPAHHPHQHVGIRPHSCGDPTSLMWGSDLTHVGIRPHSCGDPTSLTGDAEHDAQVLCAQCAGAGMPGWMTWSRRFSRQQGRWTICRRHPPLTPLPMTHPPSAWWLKQPCS